MLKICTLKMLLNFIVIVQEPWKASVSEVNQITPRDGTEPRALDVNRIVLPFIESLGERGSYLN